MIEDPCLRLGGVSERGEACLQIDVEIGKPQKVFLLLKKTIEYLLINYSLQPRAVRTQNNFLIPRCQGKSTT